MAARATPAPPVDTLRPPAGDVPTWADGELTWIRARAEWATLYDVAQLAAAADVDALAVPGGDAMLAAWAWEDEAAGRVRARVFPNGIGIEEDEATGAAALQLGALIGRDVVIRQGEGSELHARPGGDGTVAVGGRVELESEHSYAVSPSGPQLDLRSTIGRAPTPRSCCAAGAAPACRSTCARSPSRSSRSAACRSSGTWSRSTRAQGVERVLLLTGYRSELVAEFAAAAAWPGGVRVECVDTGLDTPTGGRIHAVADRLAGAPYFATYGDGVADVDLAALSDAPRGRRRRRDDDRRPPGAAVRRRRARRRATG